MRDWHWTACSRAGAIAIAARSGRGAAAARQAAIELALPAAIGAIVGALLGAGRHRALLRTRAAAGGYRDGIGYRCRRGRDGR
ncbi:MAG: hypothetical protein R3F18_04945 [Lysobacterales bacterium]